MHVPSLLADNPAADARSRTALPQAGECNLHSARGWLLAVLISAAFFAATAPELHRLDFFDGVEHINLATVLELRRDGHPKQWLVPELERDPRVVKPPLTAWIAAVSVRAVTIRDLASRDPVTRSAAFERFVWECRWPTLFCTCLLLLGVYELGRVIGGRGNSGDWKVGVFSVLICASSLLLLRQGRRATTDLQLALWVTMTNVFLAKLIVERRPWLGSIGAGISLGLAIMSKGPHIALLQTVLPVALFACYRRMSWIRALRDSAACGVADPLRRSPQVGNPASPICDAASGTNITSSNRQEFPINGHQPRTIALPLAAGGTLAALIGLWWYAYVLLTVPGVWHIWFHEVTRIDANALKPDPWYQYGFFMLRFLMPWTAWVLLGVGYAVYQLLFAKNGDAPPSNELSPVSPETNSTPNIVLALLLLLVPLLVMSFFGERKERYLIPMIGPAAVLAAYALSLYFHAARPPLLPRMVALFTWLMIAVLAVGIPVLGAARVKSFLRPDGGPWFNSTESAAAAGLAAGLLFLGLVGSRRWRPAGMIAIVLAAWFGNEMQLRGYIAADADEENRSERRVAEQVWRDYPDAVLYDAESPTRYGSLSLPAIMLSLYSDRLIQLRPASLPTEPGDRPLLLLTESPERRPVPLPRGWRRVNVLPIYKGKQCVDVLAR